MDIRQPSTHLSRYRGKDQELEAILEDWGVWHGMTVLGLSLPATSPVSASIQLYHPSDKPQPKQTRSTQPQIPYYWRHIRLSRINQAIGELKPQYYNILKYYYSEGKTAQDMGWTSGTFHVRLSEARRALRKHPVISKFLTPVRKTAKVIKRAYCP